MHIEKIKYREKNLKLTQLVRQIHNDYDDQQESNCE